MALRVHAITISVIACLVIGFAIPASAATANYGPISGPTGFGGSGASEGEFEFIAVSPRRLRWIGGVRDICPGDSKGIELRIRIRKINDTHVMWNNVYQYQGNCGDWQYINFPFTHDIDNSQIKEVRAEVWATEAGLPQFTVVVSAWKDNPYT